MVLLNYSKVNVVTVPGAYPMHWMDDCVDHVRAAKFVSKLDWLKGYWWILLTQRASDISAFVTPDSFAQYTVMVFGIYILCLFLVLFKVVVAID